MAECRRHLADPAHTVVLSGSIDPGPLRVLKVTLIQSALALLVGGEGRGGVGPRWFGREAPVEPKSMHVWPDDSTTYVFIHCSSVLRFFRSSILRFFLVPFIYTR